MSIMRLASSGLRTSPFPIKGIRVKFFFTSPRISQSAFPSYICTRVRPCIATALAPARSAARAFSTAYKCSWSHPVRIFTVTGLSTASTTAATISYTLFGSSNHFAPASALITLFTGHPMLISIIAASVFSATYFAASTKVSLLPPMI